MWVWIAGAALSYAGPRHQIKREARGGTSAGRLQWKSVIVSCRQGYSPPRAYQCGDELNRTVLETATVRDLRDSEARREGLEALLWGKRVAAGVGTEIRP